MQIAVRESMSLTTITRLPLLPLSDEVHFPCTELLLRILEPDYCALVEELFIDRGTESRVGIVLLKPEWAQQGGEDVFKAGTAGRLLGVETHDAGCDVLLRGEYRFELEQEIAAGPCRAAVVRPVTEPSLGEADPGVRLVRGELVDHVFNLAGELGESFPLPEDEIFELCDDDVGFEEVVNFLSAHLDLTPLAKLELLNNDLPERALHLLTILKSRLQLVEVLRSFRHLELNHELN